MKNFIRLSVISKPIDFAEATVQGLLGVSAEARATVEGEVGPNGMVMDFKVLKVALNHALEFLDHRVLIPKSLLRAVTGETFLVSGQDWEMSGHRDSFVLAESEAASIWARKTVQQELSATIRCISVDLNIRPGQIGYVHALAGYPGACCRIHGHSCDLKAKDRHGEISESLTRTASSMLDQKIVCNWNDLISETSEVVVIGNTSMTIKCTRDKVFKVIGKPTLENILSRFKSLGFPGIEMSEGITNYGSFFDPDIEPHIHVGA